jgi:type VI secretion system protein ImpG
MRSRLNSHKRGAFPMHFNTDDYDELLRHQYELELEFLRRDLRRFAQKHQGAAARVSINGDGRSDDPSIERLVQSAALLHARHRLKIDDDYPEFAEALARKAYPQYLRSVPACAVAQFDIEGAFDRQTAPMRIARGATLMTKAEGCRFRTAYDVVLAPLRIACAQYASTPAAPTGLSLPADTSGVLSVTFCATGPASADVAMPDQVRVHLAGQQSLVAEIIDSMLLRTTSAYVEDGAGRWIHLPAIPLKAVGFGREEWLFTGETEAGASFAMLAEYFAFVERFHFVDVDFGALRAAAPGRTLTLHLAVARIPPDSRAAQQLADVRADHFKLFCTPIVNLFTKKGVPLKYDPQGGAWPIPLEDNDEALTEIWSIDRVVTEHGKTLASSASSMTRAAGDALPIWALTKNGHPGSPDAAGGAALVLSAADGRAVGSAGIEVLGADVTCSNGDLPRSLHCGAPDGDMRMEAQCPVAKITLLQIPTAVVRLSRTNGALWRFIDRRTPQSISLDQRGLPGLKQLFQQFAVLSPLQPRHIDGITALSCLPVMTMIAKARQPALVRGMEITLETDERLFAGHSVAAFAGVMERFFAPYAHGNSFVRLRIVSASGVRLWCGEPIRGSSPLL